MRSRVRPLATRMTIAAALIVRDEARCIARCLDSIRPHVDRMIVVDTGSTDATPALAAGCGAEVHHLPWPDDFAAARNHALSLTDADWNLVIDADEWIAPGGTQLRAWCRQSPRIGSVCVHSALGAGQAAGGEHRNWLPRLLPRGVRYEGRIHEQPISPLPRARIDLHLGHDGYLAAQVAQKRDRNRPLLLRELSERPGAPYLLYQLGKDAELHEEFDAAAAHYAAAFEGAAATAGWRHALVLRFLTCLGRIGAFDTALSLAESEMPIWRESPDFFFVVGNLAFRRATHEPANALTQWLPLAASAWERCLEIGERPDLEGSRPGCGSHLARHNLTAARTQIAVETARAEFAGLGATTGARLHA